MTRDALKRHNLSHRKLRLAELRLAAISIIGVSKWPIRIENGSCDLANEVFPRYLTAK